jgi:hypothetical protein
MCYDAILLILEIVEATSQSVESAELSLIQTGFDHGYPYAYLPLPAHECLIDNRCFIPYASISCTPR